MQFEREKLKQLVLYACTACEPENMGATKLHKVLYFADMLAFANYGRAITGAVYRKRPHGPTCDALLSALEEMKRDGVLLIETEDYYGYSKRVFRPRKKPDMLRFSAEEMALIDEVIQFVCRANSARTISEFSHNRAWEMAEFGEALSYNSAFYMYPTQVSQEALDWAEGEAELIESSRSDANALGSEDYAAFRSRVLGPV